MRSFSVLDKTLCAVFLVLWGALVYSNTLGVPFYFDDILNIVAVPAIHLKRISFDSIAQLLSETLMPTRPVANLSFALNYYFHGDTVAGFHLVNITIHLTCSLVIFLIFQNTLDLDSRISGRKYNLFISFGAALLWLTHPVNTQTVTYIVQRMNGLAVMFYLIAFYCYIRGRLSEGPVKIKWSWFLISVFSWFLALGSKEIAVTLPLVLFIYEWFFFQDLSYGWFKKSGPYFAGAGVAMVLVGLLFTGNDPFGAILQSYHLRDFSLPERLLTESRVVVHYLSLLLFPTVSRLGLEHDFIVSGAIVTPATTLLSILLISLLLYLAVVKAKKNRLLSFSILWFVINLVLESTIIPLEIIFEHRTYLPYVFVVLLLVTSAASLFKKDYLIIFLLSLTVLGFSFITYQRNEMWRNPVLFWEMASTRAPVNARAHNYYGMALADERRYSDAIREYNKAISLKPAYHNAQINLGVSLYYLGNFADAKRYLLLSLAGGSFSKGKAYNNLGLIYVKEKDYFKALDYFNKSLKLNQDNPDIHSNLGTLFAEMGQLEQAIYHLEKSLSFSPNSASTRSNLGNVLVMQGQPEKAIIQYEKALRIDPKHNNSKRNLEYVFRKFPGLRRK